MIANCVVVGDTTAISCNRCGVLVDIEPTDLHEWAKFVEWATAVEAFHDCGETRGTGMIDYLDSVRRTPFGSYSSMERDA